MGEPPPTRTTPVFFPRSFASSTMAVVSFTSMLGLTRSLLPRSSTPATFMPMVESPGDEQKQGTPGAIGGGQHRGVLAARVCRSNSAQYLPIR